MCTKKDKQREKALHLLARQTGVLLPRLCCGRQVHLGKAMSQATAAFCSLPPPFFNIFFFHFERDKQEHGTETVPNTFSKTVSREEGVEKGQHRTRNKSGN